MPGKRGAASGWLCIKGSSQPTRQDAGVRCSARLVSLTARVDVDAAARAAAAQVGHRTTRPRRRYRSAVGRHLAVARHWRARTDPRGANLHGSKLASQHPPCPAPPAQPAQGWHPRPLVRGLSVLNALRADAGARLGWGAQLGWGARLGWGKPEPLGPQCARLRRLRWLAPQRQGLPDRPVRLRWLARPAQTHPVQARPRLHCFGWSLWFSARLVVARLQLSCGHA